MTLRNLRSHWKSILGAALLALMGGTFALSQAPVNLLATVVDNDLINVTPASGTTPTFASAKLSVVRTYINLNGAAPAGGFTYAPNLVSTGNWKPLAITDGTSTTCVATTTYIGQIFIPANATLTGVSIVNSTAVAGNVTVQLADSTGAPIAAAKSATTAASGTAAYQRIPFAVAYAAVGPATYYVMMQCDNTSELFRTHTVGDFRTQSVTSGVYGTFAAFTPATTFTTAVAPVASLY